MNLVFFALLDDFVSFFKDGVFSNIDFDDFSGSNVRDMLKSYFEKNPIPDASREQFDSNFLLQGIVNLQNIIADVSFGDSLVASAPI